MSGDTLTASVSGEVDVVGETSGSGSIDESQERGSLGGPRSPSDHDDDAVVRSVARESKKVVSIAGDDDQFVAEGVVENRCVGSLARKHFAHAAHLMSEMFEKVAQILRDVLVKEKVHVSPGDICRATKTSISPRWSS